MLPMATGSGSVLGIALAVGVVVGVVVWYFMKRKLESTVSAVRRRYEDILSKILGYARFLLLTDLSGTCLILKDAIVKRDEIVGWDVLSGQEVKLKIQSQRAFTDYMLRLAEPFAKKIIYAAFVAFRNDQNGITVVPLADPDELSRIAIEGQAYLKAVSTAFRRDVEYYMSVFRRVVEDVSLVADAFGEDLEKVAFVLGLLSARWPALKEMFVKGCQAVETEFSMTELEKLIRELRTNWKKIRELLGLPAEEETGGPEGAKA